MKVVLDVENTVTERGGKLHLDPYEPTNALVMVGLLFDTGEHRVFTFNHSEKQSDSTEQLHNILSDCTVLIGHNLVHDLTWLWETGFQYDGPIWDTMVAEYILQEGQKNPLSLDACSERYDLTVKKQDTLHNYLKQGYSVADIPHAELSEYLIADLKATQELALKQRTRLLSAEYSRLMPTVELTNQVTKTLARMNRAGIKVDRDALEQVRDEFVRERNDLVTELDHIARDLMGDYPLNLNSPEQLSWLIYSRKPKDKKDWADNFHDRMADGDFRSTVNSLSTIMYKQKAKQCKDCFGSGKVRKTKKNGEPFARPTRCSMCNGEGYLYESTDEIAGLKFRPPNPKWVSANGFSTNKQDLTLLAATATRTNNTVAQNFLSKVTRLSAVETYLSSFVDGIDTFTKSDGMLHVQLTQTITSTGRFSGRNPNMQNMPRGGTFPVKKCFVSRWKGGSILEADFAQLEFRVAAFLSQDKLAIEEVSNGFDVHSYTAKVISDAGQPTSRQQAKAHTFAPLYGATGFGRSPSEARYYEHFGEKYKGISRWHKELAKEALNDGRIRTPSGRSFAFPDVIRRANGTPTYFTQIKNYPVQSFATADIVPLALLYIEKQLERKDTCIVNTVHDSIVLDVHPAEINFALNVIQDTNKNLKSLIDIQWGIDFNVPLLLEAKIGPNWLDTKDVT